MRLRVFIYFLIIAFFVCGKLVKEEQNTDDQNGEQQEQANKKDNFEIYKEQIKMWEIFKQEYEKEYQNEYIEKKRFKIFRENLQQIDELNKEENEGNAEFGITQFTDLTAREFKRTILMNAGKIPVHTKERYRQFKEIRGPIPTAFDWTQYGAVTPVKNQGSVGTCWAFSTTGNIEGQWKLSGHDLISLSEQQLVDCDATTNPPNADCGVFGGWPYLAMEYIMKVGGIASNTDYPYCVGIGGKNACYPCSAPGYNETLCGPGLYPPMCNDTKWPCMQGKVPYSAHISSWDPISKNETVIQYTLLETGPLSVLLNAAKLQFYRKGVFAPKYCSPKGLDHAVLITGYGVTSPTDPKSPNTDYWVVKNSWGAKWGMNGYFNIKRGVGMCGINQQVITASILKKSEQSVKDSNTEEI